MASFTSTQSGNWTDPATWGETVEYPGKSQDDDRVIIDGHNVVYNMDNSSGYYIGNIQYKNGAEFSFSTSMDTYLKINAINSATDGIISDYNGSSILRIGTSSSPLSSSYTCTIEYSDSSADSHYAIYAHEPVYMYGAEKTIKGVTTSSLSATDTSFTMTSVPSDWATGDSLVILPTGSTITETDYVDITSISGTTVNIDSVSYSHLSGAVILNLQRNIIIKSGTTKPKAGIKNTDAINIFSNVLMQDMGDSTTSYYDGGFYVGGNNKQVLFDGCVSMGCSSSGFALGGNPVDMKNCITINNNWGMAMQNDMPLINIYNSWFVDNTSHGLYIYAKGMTNIDTCYFVGNGGAGIQNNDDRAWAVTLNSQLYANNIGWQKHYGSHNEFHSCLFGESDIGTQENSSEDVYFDRGNNAKFNDCKFSSSTDFSIEDTKGLIYASSNHNQTANTFKEHYHFGWQNYGDVTTDTSTYRTTSPSIKFDGNYMSFNMMYKVPIKVSNGDSVSVTLYGKASATSGWEVTPYATMVGCGISDRNDFNVSDTNWNSITLTGTASRSGVITLFVFANDRYNTFNIDDITVSVS